MGESPDIHGSLLEDSWEHLQPPPDLVI